MDVAARAQRIRLSSVSNKHAFNEGLKAYMMFIARAIGWAILCDIPHVQLAISVDLRHTL